MTCPHCGKHEVHTCRRAPMKPLTAAERAERDRDLAADQPQTLAKRFDAGEQLGGRGYTTPPAGRIGGGNGW